MPFAVSIENSIIDHWDGKSTWTAPAAVWVGLSSTTPTSSGSNVTEPSGGSYGRVQQTAGNMASASGGTAASTADLTFPTATADWVSAANLTYAVFYTASTVGTFIGYSALTVAKPVLNGDTAKILSGALTITVS